MPDQREALLVLRERIKWLTARIKAKNEIGWDTQWDERERNAVMWAVAFIGGEDFRWV